MSDSPWFSGFPSWTRVVCLVWTSVNHLLFAILTIVEFCINELFFVSLLKVS